MPCTHTTLLLHEMLSSGAEVFNGVLLPIGKELQDTALRSFCVKLYNKHASVVMHKTGRNWELESFKGLPCFPHLASACISKPPSN